MIIEQPPKLFRYFYRRALWRIRPEERAVYLTFDDGPIPEVTTWVLELLQKEGIKATFFMVGDNVRKYPEVFRQVVEQGHGVGNHTFHHISGARHTSYTYLGDTDEANELLHTRLFRPPHGWMRLAQYRSRGHQTLPAQRVPGQRTDWQHAVPTTPRTIALGAVTGATVEVCHHHV